MNYWTDFRVKFYNFFKKHKKKIIIILIVYAIIFAFNQYLKYLNSLNKNIEAPIVTYEPHKPIIDKGEEVPEKYKEPINKLIDEYFKYCNSGEYEKAYLMLSEDCKKAYFENLESFTKYIDTIFEHKNKTYNIQNYSNKNAIYIYNVNILDDVLATGTTGEENFEYYQEQIVIKEENNNLKLSICSYINSEQKEIIAEDENMIIKILNIQTEYDSEIYTVEVTNKTDYVIVLVDNYETEEVLLDLSNGNSRNLNNLKQTNFVIWPNSTNTRKLKFIKYFDENRSSKSLTFNKIRIFEKYTGQKPTTQEDLNNAIKIYNKTISLE